MTTIGSITAASFRENIQIENNSVILVLPVNVKRLSHGDFSVWSRVSRKQQMTDGRISLYKGEIILSIFNTDFSLH